MDRIPRSILIDTNLLLVVLIASADPNHVPRFKRTQKYTLEDVRLLSEYLTQFDQIVVTPHVLAEVSNLSGQLTEPLHRDVRERLGALVLTSSERIEPSADVVKDPLYQRLGLTDAGLARAGEQVTSVLTDDFALYLSLAHRGVPVVNFNHLRAAEWSK